MIITRVHGTAMYFINNHLISNCLMKSKSKHNNKVKQERLWKKKIRFKLNDIGNAILKKLKKNSLQPQHKIVKTLKKSI